MLLLAITLVGSMSFYLYSQQTVVTASHRRIAAEIAGTKLEDIKQVVRTQGYAALLTPGALWAQASNVDIATGVIGRVDVAIIAPDPGLAYQQVTVTVTWRDPGNPNERQIRVSTNIAL
jgi:hypothetical protein